MRFLPDGRRNRSDRHVEGVRRTGSGRADRFETAAHVCRAGRGLRPMVRRSSKARSSPSGGKSGDGGDRNTRAQGGRRFPDPPRGTRERRAGIAVSEEAILQAVEDAAHDEASCSVPKAARFWQPGARRSARTSRKRTSASCCSIARTETNIRWPARSKRLKLAEADPAALYELAHKRVNPGNRSCRGSMLLPSFEFGSTKAQYMRVTVVPADSCHSRDKSVSESVDKPVEIGIDLERLEKRPRRAEIACRDSNASGRWIRVLDEADAERLPASAPETQICAPEATAREPCGQSLFLQTDEQEATPQDRELQYQRDQFAPSRLDAMARGVPARHRRPAGTKVHR